MQVDADAVIGEVDGGWAGLTRTLDAVRTGAASEMLGVGAGAMARTVDYLKRASSSACRSAASRRSSTAPRTSIRELEVARAAVLKAQQLLDAGDPAAERAVMVAKAMAGLPPRWRCRRACRCTAASA